MAIIGRKALQEKFNTNAIPSQKDFCDLIDSLLNKRDDRFFGYWQSGIAYQEGDVVIYNKAIYMLVLKDTATEGATDSPQKLPEMAKKSVTAIPDTNQGETEAIPTSICSSERPSEDARWCLLELDIVDNDWKVLGDEPNDTMYAMVYGKIGMGTESPTGRVDMQEEGRGQFIFNPEGSEHPSIKLVDLSPNNQQQFVAKNLNADYAEWQTNVPIGYLFKKEVPVESEPQLQISKARGPKPPAKSKPTTTTTALELMVITSNEERANVGINTTMPTAMLDILEQEKRQILVNPNKNNLPELIWLNLDPGSDQNYLSAKVDLREAIFTTNADTGYRFKIGKDYETYCNPSKTDGAFTVLSLDNEGNVGIGTDTPVSKLQITDQESGDVRVGFSNANPCLSIINLRPASIDNYFALGADNDFAVMVTDAKNGFVFKKGGKGNSTDNDAGNEENINQGDNIVYIHPEGKVGIGTHPNAYELDVAGLARANNLYLDTDASKIMRTGDLENVLPNLCKLSPIKFKWDPKKTNCAAEGEQLGFFANQISEYFPELVKVHADATKAVAYQNMVAVLVQAIKEQQTAIEALKQRVVDLEEGRKKGM